MSLRKLLLNTLIILLSGLAPVLSAAGDFTHNTRTQAFIDDMVKKHGFDRAKLKSLFDEAQKREDILEAIARPAEKTKPWHEYRQIFLTPDRIRGGAKFWREHATVLERAAKKLQVDPAVVVAIIGVETRYGKHTGGYRVLDALSTLAFAYPPRSKFFRSELEQFLILAQEEKVDLRTARGSYAGAMGYGQFIPSSYRNYAIDFDKDGRRDLWGNIDDIIGSVANYFHRHGWQPGEPVANRVTQGNVPASLVSDNSKPDKTAGELAALGIRTTPPLSTHQPVAVLELQQRTGPEYWLTSKNFYVITRYNRSPLYAMSVYQLSEAIRDAYQKDP
ncbi:membrane-bound lytic murein transglycosylase B [Thiogranum longum]|uniref:Membrane-bound lytic murein transglycosylase B n=1 Tax=Thiogranum longum TaxID=1537524 RepID=A0A4R1HCQ9_9GAMM|nr:lytic murein transglycosylase B [Thiogranum longum]TCK19238.1 membrane-bound lytic murein transglycosylase B [Thiogranum longum]